jgi:hypothetical protein
MKIRLLFFAILVVAIGAFSGCYHDNLQEMTPGAGLSNINCDTTGTMTYAYHIAPIMTASCGTSTCHGASNPYVNLSAYAGVKKSVLNGQLWNCINGTGGISPMPKNSAPLSSCNIKKIKKWIDDGAPNN